MSFIFSRSVGNKKGRVAETLEWYGRREEWRRAEQAKGTYVCKEYTRGEIRELEQQLALSNEKRGVFVVKAPESDPED